MSAPASFTAGAVLAAIGTALIRRVKTKRLLPLALIPCFFAVQQFAEGVVWLNLSGGSHSAVAAGAKNVFVFFAYIFWPLWIPASFWAAELNPLRKQMIAACFGVGLALASFLACLIPHIEAVSYRWSIQYLFAANSMDESPFQIMEQFGMIAVVFYGAATLLPLFAASLKRAWVLGMCAAIAGIAIYSVDRYLFVSLWCFFSALISIALFIILPKKLR